MISLRELLTEEGFNQTKPSQHSNLIKPLRPKHEQKGSSSCQPNAERAGSASAETWNSKSFVSPENSRREGPPMDEVAIRAVIAILSGYIGRYIKDDFFRRTILEKCNSYLVRRKRRNGSESDEEVLLVNMKLGIENIDKLVIDQGGTEKELRIKSLRNSIELLTIVASLNSKKTSRWEATTATTCGIPNSHLSACAQLYLAIVYKLQKNNRVCARHLMQVFCDAPFLARTYLVPDLWENFFLPHLLHLKIWYTEELETLSNSNECDGEKEKKMKSLRRVYDNKVDTGTIMFALYYKQWLKVGANEPPLPVISLPSASRPTSNGSSKRRFSDSFIVNSSINTNLYMEVFGPKLEQKLTNLDDQNGLLTIRWGSDTNENLHVDEYYCTSEEDEAEIHWRRVASALFKSGNKKLLSALADSAANGITSLAQPSFSIPLQQ